MSGRVDAVAKLSPKFFKMQNFLKNYSSPTRLAFEYFLVYTFISTEKTLPDNSLGYKYLPDKPEVVKKGSILWDDAYLRTCKRWQKKLNTRVVWIYLDF